MSTIDRYPLQWPTSWPRARSRRWATFGTKKTGEIKRQMTVANGCERLFIELRRLGVKDGGVVVSTNIRTRLDGLPYGNQPEPTDPGVAVYFRLKGHDRVLACDTWTRVADNITAIAAHIDCIRAMERYGVGSLDQAFAGYTALPSKGSTWRTTLGFGLDQVISREEIEAAFRERARTAHPDVQGGSHDAMASLVQARQEAFDAIEAPR